MTHSATVGLSMVKETCVGKSFLKIGCVDGSGCCKNTWQVLLDEVGEGVPWVWSAGPPSCATAYNPITRMRQRTKYIPSALTAPLNTPRMRVHPRLAGRAGGAGGIDRLWSAPPMAPKMIPHTSPLRKAEKPSGVTLTFVEKSGMLCTLRDKLMEVARLIMSRSSA